MSPPSAAGRVRAGLPAPGSVERLVMLYAKHALRRAPTALVATMALFAAPAWAFEYPGEALGLEAHGFASFGWLAAAGNNWFGVDDRGTTQFWEAAANVIARPVDRLRLGAQIYARDLSRYDNGRATLDWAYADWRAADALGVTVGRFKIPFGLYNEELDVDAARVPIFLPLSIYALRTRDFYISNDGVKVYGLVQIGGGGSVEYALHAGRKSYNTTGGFATYLTELGLGERIDAMTTGLNAGGMLQWNTPWSGLALRASLLDLHDFRVDAASPATATTSHTQAENYWQGVLSAQLELPSATLAAEYLRIHGRARVEVAPIGFGSDLVDNSAGAYASATWHARRWLEPYAAFEATWADAYHDSASYLYAAVLAVRFQPLAHWSLKAEFRDVWGTTALLASDNPSGFTQNWQIFALKTTVDF